MIRQFALQREQNIERLEKLSLIDFLASRCIGLLNGIKSASEIISEKQASEDRTRETITWGLFNSEFLQKEGSNCDNRQRSGKPHHVYCSTFESSNTGSTCS